METYHLSKEVYEIIVLLTKKSGLNEQELGIYFDKIRQNPKVALIKLADRLHNCSSLYTFNNKRMRKYIQETDQYILPMASFCKHFYPIYGKQFYILKNSISNMNQSMDVMLKRIEACNSHAEDS